MTGYCYSIIIIFAIGIATIVILSLISYNDFNMTEYLYWLNKYEQNKKNTDEKEKSDKK
ncbi:MAG: hypothetical protein BWX85_01094 [Chloroflexi bacterium ADurb.Bin120]|jgi:hypothetical protein|nr:MAG: hypothetical protein BWX85_01094 [Chloroflexi bacterium ADurb.Bin120]